MSAAARKTDGKSAAKPNLIAHFLSSGSSRVLNSLMVGQHLVESQGAEAKLMFATPALNRGLVFKDLTGVIAVPNKPKIVRVGTKIYLPFNRNRLEEGGQTGFFDRFGFEKMMAGHVDLGDRARVDGLKQDLKLLTVLDKLPMFAPFLVRQALDRENIAIDPLYVDVPEDEWTAICAYIRGRFQQILVAVTGAANTSNDALDRLLDKLWELKDLKALQSLARAFGLPPENCLDIFYAWKGMIYFCWLYERVQPQLVELMAWLEDAARVGRLLPPNRRGEARDDLADRYAAVSDHLTSVEGTIADYERGFSELFVKGAGPKRFVEFLNAAPTKFVACGIGIGILQHAHEVWDRLTGNFPDRDVGPQAFDDVLTALGGVLAQTET